MIATLLDKAAAGERLTPEEGLLLLESRDLAAIGGAADAVTRRLHPEPYRTYNIDRNINYTNVCTAVCRLLCVLPQAEATKKATCCSRRELLEKVERRWRWAAIRS